MSQFILAAASLLLLASGTPPTETTTIAGRAAALRDAAWREDRLGWDIVEGLTTEVGPRPAGTEADTRARTWAVRRLRDLGFANVHVEPFAMPVWIRGEERAEIVAPFPQPMHVAALGNSGTTPPGGIEAEIIAFDSVAALTRARDEDVRGRIVFITHAMMPTQDGSSYAGFRAPRREGPSVASRKGAAAIVIRSIGTDHHRNAHTGIQTWADGARPIPAGALSIPDAEQLQRILARGQPVRMRLLLRSHTIRRRMSGNVVAEVPGSDPAAGTILIGAHLDSWDLSPAAFDNASGVAITIAAAHRIMAAGRPRRTIRVVLFGAEEVGEFGSESYFQHHRAGSGVVFVAESDFGADRVWRVNLNLAASNAALGDRIAALLAPLGIVRGQLPAAAGVDLGPWVRSGVAAVDLDQDGTRYFDYHHTPDDTLDKVDPAQLRQNVAAWTAMLAAVADSPEPVHPIAPAH